MSIIDTALHWWRHADNNAAALPSSPDGALAKSALAATVAQSLVKPVMKSVTPGASDPPYLAALERCGLPRTLVYPSTTLGRLIDQTADRFGAATAVVYNHRTWTWEEIRQQCNRLAGGLATLGVRRGDRVVMTLPNCPEYIIAFLAIQKLGAVLVNAGPLMGADDLQQVLSMTSARVVIGLDLQSPLLAKAGKDSTVEHWVWVSLAFYQSALKRLGYHLKLWQETKSPANREQHITLNELMDNAPARPPTVESQPDRTAVLQPTGGTTGGVKLVQLSHRNLLANTMQVAVWAGAQPGQERILAVLPMFHVYGLTSCLMTAVFGGHQLIVVTRFSANEVLELIHRYRPTILPIVPAMCDPLCDAMERETAAHARRHHNNGTPVARLLDSVKACISGAAPLPPTIAQRFTRVTGIELLEGYGLSEAAPVTHINPIGFGRASSIGLPMPDTRCRIVDLEDGTTEVAAGQTGELLVSGPQVMSGYFSNAEATQRAISVDPDGTAWLHTGDVVRMDDDGYFRVMDRKKDMIIRSGLKVYPAKVERVLRLHPQVTDAGVIGRPDLLHTEEVVAFVASPVAVEQRPALAIELRKLCREHLAPYEVPAKVEFLDKLPRSGLGKLLKKDLRLLEAPAVAAEPSSTEVTLAAENQSSDQDPDGGPADHRPSGDRPGSHEKEAA